MKDVERRHGGRAAGEAIGEVVGDAFVEVLLAALWRLVLLPLHVVEHLLAGMTTIASRDLRNHTADVLRQVAGGTHVTITVNGRSVAEIRPVRASRPQFLSKAELIELTTRHQADPGLTADLELLAGDTTGDLAAP